MTVIHLIEVSSQSLAGCAAFRPSAIPPPKLRATVLPNRSRRDSNPRYGFKAVQRFSKPSPSATRPQLLLAAPPSPWRKHDRRCLEKGGPRIEGACSPPFPARSKQITRSRGPRLDTKLP